MFRRLYTSSVLLLAAVLTVVFLFRYGKARTTFGGDALGYYAYLPSALIHHNVTRPFTADDKHMTLGMKWYFDSWRGAVNERGNYLNQYTYGVALMEAPFFLAAHVWERVCGLDADGYSDTYDNMIKLGMLVYAWLGLLVVYRILTRYFDSIVSFTAVVSIFLCSHFFWFAIIQPGMAHIPLFFLYSLLVWLSVATYEKPSTLRFAATGIVAGIITLIRPTDILCLLIPLLYNVYNRQTIQDKIVFIKANGKGILVMAVAFVVPITPQLFYWKAVTGNYICYSYGDQSFDFRHPHIIDGLFSFSNGWLPYAPVMIFALAGMVFYKTLQNWIWCIGVLFAAYVYVIYSWYCYNYLNGLGSRPMIHLYPLLALPLGAFFSYISRRHFAVKLCVAVLCLFFCSVNLCFSVQEAEGVLDSPESNMPFNLQMLYRDSLCARDLVVKDIGEWQPDERKLTRVSLLHLSAFEDSLNADYIRDTVNGSRYCYHWHDNDLLLLAKIPYDEAQFKGAKWFKCSGRFMNPNQLDYFRHLLVLDINDHEKLWRGLKIENNIPDANTPMTLKRCVVGKWGEVSYFSKVPGNLKTGDTIKLIVWSSDKRDIYMDDVQLELYK
jgi:hypothetical protein